MELLVSVRSAAEVEAALAGGADIIDAKEPGHGPLGSVSPEVLADIVVRVPQAVSLSVALGDQAISHQLISAVASLQLPGRPAPLYLKVGFAGVRSEDRIERLIAAAVAAASDSAAAPPVVAVTYADAVRAGTAAPDTISRLASRVGAAGILLDTHTKDGVGLLSWVATEALTRWVTEARGAGLLTAVAGGLRLEDLEPVSAASPDVLGVRGAACSGGRDGRVSLMRVRALRRGLDLISGSIQGSRPLGCLTGSRNA
jgi:(5-formylfuran-3-yl)methyl phosphate synthase